MTEAKESFSILWKGEEVVVQIYTAHKSILVRVEILGKKELWAVARSLDTDTLIEEETYDRIKQETIKLAFRNLEDYIRRVADGELVKDEEEILKYELARQKEALEMLKLL